MQTEGFRPEALSFPSPLYVVAAPLTGGLDANQPLFITDALPEGTFDEELLPILPAISYVMHLPKTRFETLDLSLQGVQAGDSRYDKSHSIALIPDQMLTHAGLMRVLVARHDPVLIVATARAMGDARQVSSSLGFSLQAVCVEDLDQQLMEQHWHELADAWSSGWPPNAVGLDRRPLLWSWPIQDDGSLLSLQRLRRLMGSPLGALPTPGNPFDSALQLRAARIRLNALAQMERNGVDPGEVVQLLPDEQRRQALLSRVSLALGVSGTAPRYVRFSVGSEGVTQSTFRDDYPDVRGLLVTHAAVREDSTGIILEDALTPPMFVALADLERGWANENVRPASVRKLLTRLDAAATPLWTEDLVQLVKAASRLDVFSNFPIGLLTLPGDSEPLAGRLPISYLPLNPLTRALQIELSPQNPTDLSHQLKVLIVECIPDSDPVGRSSRNGWSTLVASMTAHPHVAVTVIDTFTPKAVRDAVSEIHPDVVVISAHGFHDPEHNVAGIVVGDTWSMGDDLGDMPPLVILSACHTTPRGGGVVSVGELLLGAGAIAVLTALVPVSVHHNSTLVTRFLGYLALASGPTPSEPEETVLDVWHRVQSSNVVIDLAYGNPRLRDWTFGRSGVAPSPIEQFMSSDHGIPLRPGHLYEDAERRLLAVASPLGDESECGPGCGRPATFPKL